MSYKGFKRGLTLSEYSEKYAECLKFERDNGVLTVSMHTDGGPCKFSVPVHHMIADAWLEIGRDPENEVVIVTGTGGQWFDMSEIMSSGPSKEPYEAYQAQYSDSMRLFESFLTNIEVPTIAALTAPGPFPPAHVEFALACDLTLCSDTTVFGDLHFAGLGPGWGAPCGDGQGLALEELFGLKRTAYMLYTGQTIDAQTALRVGAVNEVLPEAELLARCQEIAHQIIACSSRASRRLQSQLLKHPWKQRIANDYQLHLSHLLMMAFPSPVTDAESEQPFAPEAFKSKA